MHPTASARSPASQPSRPLPPPSLCLCRLSPPFFSPSSSLSVLLTVSDATLPSTPCKLNPHIKLEQPATVSVQHPCRTSNKSAEQTPKDNGGQDERWRCGVQTMHNPT
ncbi:hypothetical protein C8F01DRAFT_1253329 [Mycena amicta]|nr:hypothetical protein C8F01DRAFT_1253329 [Mycena amicta]